MPNTVKFTIDLNVNGQNVITEVTAKSKDLAEQLGMAEKNGNELFGTLLKFNQITRSFQDVASGLQQLTGMMHTYTQAYTVQQQAETQLATAMRNTMSATDAQIQGIRELTAAQQQQGVIGDEVQLAGAQVLATHLKQASTLEKLIPLMNDMAAAQDGVNASSSTATNVAGLLGKAMDGNVNALKRMGITFTESQQKMMETGTEEQRAAILTEVLTARFGGMNQALANTAAGGLKKAENAFGDMQEKIGSVFIKVEPFIKKVSELGLAFTALGQTASAVKSLTVAIRGMSMAFGKVTLAITVLTGLVALIRKLSSSSDEASAKMKGLAQATEVMKEAEDAGVQAAANARAEMQKDIQGLENLIKSKQNTAAAVQELNNKYGEWFGQCATAQQWYDTLIKNSEVYCQQLAYEAQMRVFYEKKANLEIQREKNRQKQLELIESGKDRAANKMGGFGQIRGLGYSKYIPSKEMGALIQTENTLNAGIEKIEENIQAVRSLMTDATPLSGGIAGPGKGGGGRTGGAAGTVKGTPEYIAGQLGYFDQEISKLNQQKLKLSDPADIYNLDQMIKRLEDARTLLQYISSLKPGEREGFAGLLASGASATSQAGGGSLAPGGMTGDDWTKRIADDWESNTKAMKEYFATFQRDFPIQIYDKAKKKAAEHNKKLSDMGGLIQSAGQSFATLGKNLESPVLEAAGIIAQAIAQMLLGYAQASAASAEGSPFAWIGFTLAGLATVTTVIEQMKSIGQYAQGAIAYGPTLGIFGEYAGARNNPEVVAPLDRLRSYIGDAGGKGTVEFEIKGRTLRGLLKKENNHVGRG